jgi:hypothetical protein
VNHASRKWSAYTNSEHSRLPSERTLKEGTLFSNGGKFAEGNQLKSTAVLELNGYLSCICRGTNTYSEQIFVPPLKFMGAAGFAQNLGAWPQIKVVCVVEDERNPQGFYLLGSQTLDS